MCSFPKMARLSGCEVQVEWGKCCFPLQWGPIPWSQWHLPGMLQLPLTGRIVQFPKDGTTLWMWVSPSRMGGHAASPWWGPIPWSQWHLPGMLQLPLTGRIVQFPKDGTTLWTWVSPSRMGGNAAPTCKTCHVEPILVISQGRNP